jgi:hypothetical protein
VVSVLGLPDIGAFKMSTSCPLGKSRVDIDVERMHCDRLYDGVLVLGYGSIELCGGNLRDG